MHQLFHSIRHQRGIMRRSLDLAASRAETYNKRRVWNISSTATGDGVAEMLHVLVGYIRDTGIDIRWLVMAVSVVHRAD